MCIKCIYSCLSHIYIWFSFPGDGYLFFHLVQVKDSLRSDPRYKSVRHEDREVLFNEYISELRAAEEEVDRAAKAKREELVSLSCSPSFLSFNTKH